MIFQITDHVFEQYLSTVYERVFFSEFKYKSWKIYMGAIPKSISIITVISRDCLSTKQNKSVKCHVDWFTIAICTLLKIFVNRQTDSLP